MADFPLESKPFATDVRCNFQPIETATWMYNEEPHMNRILKIVPMTRAFLYPSTFQMESQQKLAIGRLDALEKSARWSSLSCHNVKACANTINLLNTTGQKGGALLQ
jgi:hypothetical protein